jgi:hypothetical protein
MNGYCRFIWFWTRWDGDVGNLFARGMDEKRLKTGVANAENALLSWKGSASVRATRVMSRRFVFPMLEGKAWEPAGLRYATEYA